MTRTLAVALTLISALALSVAQVPGAHAAPPGTTTCDRPSNPQVFGTTCGDSVQVSTSDQGTEQGSEGSTRQVSDIPKVRQMRHVLCADWVVPVGGSAGDGLVSWEGEIPACSEPFEVMDDFCPDGAEPLAPMWRSRLIDADSETFGPWQMVSGYECQEDPLVGAIVEAWRQMTITPQVVDVLPNNGWARATWGVMADLDDAPQTSTVSVLGTEVVLRATPTDQEWTVTDVVTGDSWPGVFETGSHGEEVIMFDRKEHRVSLGLTTTWEGHYSLNGGTTWIPAPGTATTTSEPRSVHIYNPRARLVNCDTFGDCMDGGTSRNPFTMTDPDADGIDNYEVPNDEIGAYSTLR